MKKLAILALSLLAFAGINVQADTYNNSAYMGKWISKSNTESNSTELYINYCDFETIQVDFRQITNGTELFDFKEYAAKVDNNNAYIEFEYTDEYGTTKPGYIKLSWFIDNIWVSAYSNDDIKFYDGVMYPTVEKFNPYASPYSYGVSIDLNGKLQDFEKKPFIINGTTYVPLRGILDAMNLNVYWDDYANDSCHTQLITTARNDMIIQFERNDNGNGYAPWTLTKWTSATVSTANRESTRIDISQKQPIILDGSTYIPLRMISEEYGATVDWDGATSTVLITGSVASDTKKNANEIDKIQSFSLTEAQEIAKGYAGMEVLNSKPYYTYKSKYFVFTQEDEEYRIHYNGELN